MTMTSKRLLCLALGLLTTIGAYAASNVSNDEAGSGLKAAITRGAEFAVAELGQQNGFLGNEKVRIHLPDALHKAESAARKLGFAKQAEELNDAMNHAAEAAVLEAKPLLVNTIANMSFKDAKDILFGAPDAATQYFKRTTSDDLHAKFLPVVKSATAKVQLALKYNAFAGKAAKLHLLPETDTDLDAYVTRKTMDGLFVMIAEQEKKIRADPIGTGSALLKKVFGSSGK